MNDCQCGHDLAKVQKSMVDEVERQVKGRLERELGKTLVTQKVLARAILDTEKRCDRLLQEQRQHQAIKLSKFRSEMLEEFHKYRDEVRAQVAGLLGDARTATILEGATFSEVWSNGDHRKE